MPFVRNIFRKQDENARPVAIEGISKTNGDSNKTAEISEVDSAEYKLSDINDSGICLPPSPVERKSFWGHTNSSRSTTSSNHRGLVHDSEQFNISRESFDSYRRSFDISGRSPVIRPNDFAGRSSLDSRSFHLQSSRTSSSMARPPPVPIVPPVMKEEDFEDVGLDDARPQQAKKRGLFARLTESSSIDHSPTADGRPTSSHEKSSWHHFGNRKRGQSGSGAELGSYPAVNTPKREDTPKPIDRGLKSPATPTPTETAQAPNAL